MWKKKTPQRYLDDKKRFVVTQGIEKMGMNLGQSAGKTYTYHTLLGGKRKNKIQRCPHPKGWQIER